MRQIVVTGGGTGIGYAVAAWFVQAGEQVTITGRREHVLKEAVAGLASPSAGHLTGQVIHVNGGAYLGL